MNMYDWWTVAKILCIQKFAADVMMIKWHNVRPSRDVYISPGDNVLSTISNQKMVSMAARLQCHTRLNNFYFIGVRMCTQCLEISHLRFTVSFSSHIKSE